MSSINLSRSGMSSPLGKLTFEAKTRIPESVGEELTRMASSLGISTSEYLRDLVIVHVLGEDTVRRLYQQRLDVIARKGTE